MKVLVAVLLVALLAFGVAYEALRRQIATVAEQAERKALEAVQKAREDVSASMQPLRDQGARLRREVETTQAEVRQRRSAASAAALEVKDVQAQGAVLRSGDVDAVLRECARQGYTCRMAGGR